MPSIIKIECPHGHLLELEVKYIGKRVRCPRCQIVMMVPASHVPATVAPPRAGYPNSSIDTRSAGRQDDDVEEDEVDSGESPKKVREGLRQVRVGLNLHIAKIYVLVITILLTLLIGVFAAANDVRPVGLSPIIRLLAGVAGLACLVLDILTFTRLSNCPVRTRARNLAILYICIESLSYAFTIFFVLLSDMPGSKMLYGLGNLVGIVGYVCLVIFLQRLAIYLQRDKLAAKARGLLILIGLTAFFVLLFVLVGALAGEPGPRQGRDSGATVLILGVIVLAGIVTGIWSILRYLRLIQNVRDVL